MDTYVEAGRIAKFWLPDEYRIIKEFTLTSTGKIDKKPLRKNLQGME
jgi:fatty-acyl-CoA synthase